MAIKKTIRTKDDLRDFMYENVPHLKVAGDGQDMEKAMDNAIENVSIGPIYTQDIWIYRMVVISLSAVMLAVVIGIIIISVKDEPKGDINNKIPVVLVSIISTAVGALAGLLAPSPIQSRNQ